jgi:hypothetical protein
MGVQDAGHGVGRQGSRRPRGGGTALSEASGSQRAVSDAGAIRTLDYGWQAATELTVHAWDLARAIGAQDEFPNDLIGEVLGHAKTSFDDWYSSEKYAPSIPVEHHLSRCGRPPNRGIGALGLVDPPGVLPAMAGRQCRGRRIRNRIRGQAVAYLWGVAGAGGPLAVIVGSECRRAGRRRLLGCRWRSAGCSVGGECRRAGRRRLLVCR